MVHKDILTMEKFTTETRTEDMYAFLSIFLLDTTEWHQFFNKLLA